MYANRYSPRHGFNPGGLAFALGASGVLLFGLSLSAPQFIPHFDPVLSIKAIPLPKDPPPREKPKPQPQIKDLKPVAQPPAERVDVTHPPIAPVSGGIIATHIDSKPVDLVVAGSGGDFGTITLPRAPVLRDPALDPRYIDSFQPNYPSDERLAGHAGRVVVRVLIGTDGRVKDVQQVSAASTAFFEATRKQALAKWRFKPATKDGVAVEAWHTMAVRFELNDE